MFPGLIPAFRWILAFHVISMVAWMAGMLYLPRLFVYHCAAPVGSRDSERFKVMERRLYKQIINPAMMLTWTFGILMLLTPGVIDWSWTWWQVKFASVMTMAGLHGVFGLWRKDFLHDRNRRGARFYRIANELPTALLILIVIMVIVRPF